MKRVWMMQCVLLLLSGEGVWAQVAAHVPTYSPEQTINLAISFDGPGSDKIHGVAVQLMRQGTISVDQPGFLDQLVGGVSTPLQHNSFLLSFKIPKNVATGDYKLKINAQEIVGPNFGTSVPYESGHDFEFPLIRIENSATVQKPKISVQIHQ